jgi:hypothetical protein
MENEYTADNLISQSKLNDRPSGWSREKRVRDMKVGNRRNPIYDAYTSRRARPDCGAAIPDNAAVELPECGWDLRRSQLSCRAPAKNASAVQKAARC